MGEDWTSRRGRVFGCRGDKGGLLLPSLCDGLRGDDDNGEETAGLCGEVKSRLNIGVGIAASISSNPL